MAYHETVITPCASGFGEYQLGNADGEMWEDDGDLVDAMRDGVAPAELIEITDDAELPDGMADIRGRIHGEPHRVFGFLDDAGHAHYFGILELPTQEELAWAMEQFDNVMATREAIAEFDASPDGERYKKIVGARLMFITGMWINLGADTLP